MTFDVSLIPQNRVENLITDLASKQSSSTAVTSVNNITPVNGNVSLTLPQVDQTYNSNSSNAQSGSAINGLDSTLVHKAGTETITGIKTFSGEGRITYLKSTVIDRTTPPSSGNLYAYIDVTDKNDNRLGVVGGKIGSDGKYGTYLQAGNEANIFVKSDGTNGYFEFPRCTTAATTTSTAADDKVAVIVQNYKSGASWYRIWSDGWIEQGGFCTGTQSVTFLKAYKDTDYNISLGIFRNGATGDYAVVYCYGKTTTGMSLIHAWNGGTGNPSTYWYCAGY